MPAFGQVSLVHEVDGFHAMGDLTRTFAEPSESGSTTLVAAFYSGSIVVSDSAGNTYTPLTSPTAATGSFALFSTQFFVTRQLDAGLQPLVVSCQSPTGYVQCSWLEYRGLGNPVVVDELVTVSTGLSPYDAGALRARAPGDLLISFLLSEGDAVQQVPPTSWVVRSTADADLVQDLIATEAGDSPVVVTGGNTALFGQSLVLRSSQVDAGTSSERDAGTVEAKALNVGCGCQSSPLGWWWLALLVLAVSRATRPRCWPCGFE